MTVDKRYKWRSVHDENGYGYDEQGNEIKVFCPFCSHEAYKNTDYGNYELFDFCPYCGKKMRKEK